MNCVRLVRSVQTDVRLSLDVHGREKCRLIDVLVLFPSWFQMMLFSKERRGKDHCCSVEVLRVWGRKGAVGAVRMMYFGCMLLKGTEPPLFLGSLRNEVPDYVTKLPLVTFAFSDLNLVKNIRE